MKCGQIGQMSFLLLSVQDDATRFRSCQHFIGCNPEECLSEKISRLGHRRQRCPQSCRPASGPGDRPGDQLRGYRSMSAPETMGVLLEQAHELETDQLEETRERVRSALYEKLLSLDPKQVREMLAYHLRRCTTPSCPTCNRVRERAAQRKQQRQKSEKRMRLWRGVAKSIGPMLALRARAAQTTYAPGGQGYHAARHSFESAQSHQSEGDK